MPSLPAIMAPVDWDQIMGLDAKKVTEESADEIYSVLAKVSMVWD